MVVYSCMLLIYICIHFHALSQKVEWLGRMPPLVSYLIFVGALVFEFLAPPPLDQILTTPGHQRHILEKIDTTSKIYVSNWWRSNELIGVGCEVNVRNLGHIREVTSTAGGEGLKIWAKFTLEIL